MFIIALPLNQMPVDNALEARKNEAKNKKNQLSKTDCYCPLKIPENLGIKKSLRCAKREVRYTNPENACSARVKPARHMRSFLVSSQKSRNGVPFAVLLGIVPGIVVSLVRR